MTNQVLEGYDPLEHVHNPDEYAPVFEDKGIWGEVAVDVWGPAALEKGVGKVPYDPNVHTRAPLTVVKLNLYPLGEQVEDNPNLVSLTWLLDREYIAEFNDWREYVWPSLRALGVTNLPEINGKFVHVTRVENGRTYTDAEGQEKPEKVFNFATIFDSQELCIRDYLKNGRGPGTNGGSGAPATSQPQAAPAPSSNGRDAALKFAQVIVQNAARGQSDLNVVRNTVSSQLAQYDAISQHFTVDSPEIVGMILEAMS